MADQFYYLYLFLIISSNLNVISVTEIAPPRPTLDPDSSSLNISKGSTLSITCAGKYSLQWNTTTYGNITSRTSVEETFDEFLNLHTAKLTVYDVIYSDTGYFSCLYKGTSSSDPSSNVSSIYVFVNDPNKLLVPLDNFLINIKSNTIIPCRPTNPAVNVRLFKGSTEVAVDSGDVTFDNRVGFTIVYGSIFFSGSFECVAELDNITDTLNVALMWMSSTKSIPQPSIDGNGNTHIVPGSTFVLTCLVNTEHESTVLFIDWEHPNKSSRRFSETKVTKGKRVSKNNASTFYQVLKNLTVENVEKSDEGVYKCTIRDREGKSNSQKTYIVVHETDEHTLILHADFENSSTVLRDPNTEVKYVVTIQAHPGPPELTWMKNNQVISPINNKYIIRNERVSSQYQSVLMINNLDSADTANYTLIARTDKLEKSLTMTLWVKEELSTQINQTLSYHASNKTYKHLIVCIIKGLPIPDVKWSWTPCIDITCTKSWNKIESSDSVNEISISTTRMGLSTIRSSISLIAKKSGYYMCEAVRDNQISAPAEYKFVVIDIKLNHHTDGFGIVSIDSNVLEKHRVSLECLANKFNFTNKMAWKFKKNWSSNEIDLLTKPGLSITRFETEYSYGVVATFDSIQLHDDGIYVCEAIGYFNRETRTKRINVLKTKPPYILTTNMDGSHYPIHREAPFQFICNVTGVPRVTIEWKRNNQTLSETSLAEYNFLHNYTVLEIPRVVTEDSGVYYCVAFNEFGKITLNATLQVDDVVAASAMPHHVKVIIITVVVLVIILLIVLAAVLGRKCYLDHKEREEIYELEKELFKKGAIERYNPDVPLDLQIDILPYDTRWEFPREKLKLGKTLGQGAFGRVVKADAQGILQNENNTIVAVKMLKEHANVDQRKAIMQELKIMIHLGRHVNILNLLGACIQNPRRGELLIIMEYCKYGNLRNYVLRHRSNFVNQINPETGEIDKRISGAAAAHYSVPPCRTSIDYAALGQDGYLVPLSPDFSQNTAFTTLNSDSVENTSDDSTGFGRLNMSMRATSSSKKPLTSYDLIGYAFQTSRGMEYLASRKLVHRDLAIRNILLADNNTIKISDFGLTKDCYNKAYYRKKGDAPLPVKWMAIEAIRDRIFTTESDVWAFGIVLWELFSLGSNPYPGLEVDENFYKKLLCGYRMDKPEYASDELYRIMSECWQSDPSQRPTFPEISDWIGDHLQIGMKEHYIQLNNDYLKLYQLTTANPDYINMNDTTNPLQNYVNVPNVNQSDDETTDSTKPDYLDMRGSNTSSMRAYEAARAAKNELKPMLSQGVPLRTNDSVNLEPSVKYSPNSNTNSIHLMNERKSKNNSVPPSYNSVIGDPVPV